MERTLIIAKPDAVQRGLIGETIRRLENKGLKLVGLKMMKLETALLRVHYAEHVEKPFYQGLEDFMKSSPCVVMVWEGYECTAAVRLILGATNPRQADAGTIRGDYAMGVGRNLVHASDSKESGKREVDIFFKKDEIFDYDKSEYLQVYESYERE